MVPTAELEEPSELHKMPVGHAGNVTPVLYRRHIGKQIASLECSAEGGITAKNFTSFFF